MAIFLWIIGLVLLSIMTVMNFHVGEYVAASAYCIATLSLLFPILLMKYKRNRRDEIIKVDDNIDDPKRIEDTKTIVKAGIDKSTTDLNQKLEKLGFKRTKKWIWVRLKSNSADFINLHVDGSSYGGPINNSVNFTVRCGNRELNDSFDSLALNGPDSDSPEAIERKYHLRFNAKSGSTYERCIDDLEKFVLEMGEPWYSKFESSGPIENNKNPENVKNSYKLLGIKGVKV